MKRRVAVAWSLAGTVLVAGAAVCLTSGCSALGYYAQAVGGHLAIIKAAKPVPQWLDDATTPQALKDRLALTQRIRDFAVTELKEPDNASYRRFADLKRGAAVWNVVAAPELSLTLHTWCYPFVGCVGYRGYFDHDAADAFAKTLADAGLEVSVYGVPAYSTLGRLPGDWLADPLLSTFINYPEGELARLIFHELAHQIAYAQDDTVFNESFATAVERIGGATLAGRARQPGRARRLRALRRPAAGLSCADDALPATAGSALCERPGRRRQAQRQGGADGRTARRLRNDEGRALGRVFRV